MRRVALAAAVAAATLAGSVQAQGARDGPVLARELVLRAGQPGGTLSYRWVAPSPVGLYPALARSMRADAEKQLASDRREAAELAKSGTANPRYARQVDWQITADTPRLMALVATEWLYSGGAHGNTAFPTLVWDKARSRRVALADMLADPKAGFGSLRSTFCAALDAERAKRRGGQKIGGSFDECPDLAKQPIALVAPGDGTQVSRLTVKLAPYEAGPYAEGSYEVTLDVTPAFVAALKPEWRSAFGAIG